MPERFEGGLSPQEVARPSATRRETAATRAGRFAVLAIALVSSMALVVVWGLPGVNPLESVSATSSPPVTTLATSQTSTTRLPTSIEETFQEHDGLQGVLPDGTAFRLHGPSPGSLRVERVTAAIVIELVDERDGSITALPVGDVKFRHLATEFPDSGPSFLLLTAGDWTVHIDIAPEVRQALGERTEEVFLAGIEATSRRDLPVLTLSAPFRWVRDDEAATPMQVETSEFVVRRGCEESALACNVTRGIQVLVRQGTSAAAAPDGPVVSIYSGDVPRPVTDASYLDPGPFGFQSGAHVIWTGREMIVWGGYGASGNPLWNGAAFDPESGVWRLLPDPPSLGFGSAEAVWADTRLVVFSRYVTAYLDLASDEWTVVGDGPPYVPHSPGFTVWTGDLVATWAPLGIHVFDPETAEWETLPDPGVGGANGFGALRVVGGRLYALGSHHGACGVRNAAEWTGSIWRVLPEGSASSRQTSCASPRQSGVASGRLFLWGGDRDIAAYDPATDSWTQVAAPPIAFGDSWDSWTLRLDDRLLLTLGSEWGISPHSLIYDATSGTWAMVSLPGMGQMVWTGEEVLSWGGCCSRSVVDAWRFEPPDLLTEG
jgi:hypothetical protein